MKKRIIAVICVAVVTAAVLWIPRGTKSGKAQPVEKNGLKEMAAAPVEAVSANLSAQDFMESDAHWDWWETYQKQSDASAAHQAGMNDTYLKLMQQILGEGEENAVCSPLNVYIAFSVLAETADGDTRQQILDALEASDIQTLRSNVKDLWDANSIDTPVLKSLLANSLWLRESTEFHDETLKLLAESYHASSFYGDTGSDAMTQALQDWTNANTGDLLTDYVKDLKLNESTVMALVSTIYYKAMWQDFFNEKITTDETFRGVHGDTTVRMMHKEDMLSTYRTEDWTSVSLSLTDSGSMHFFLPKEGTDPAELLQDPGILEAITNQEDERRSWPLVNLSVPKFRVSGNTDLLEIMRRLGMTDALDPGLADFTPLTTDVEDGLYVSQAEHAAMVEIDENGVTGAAYTEVELTEGAMLPEETIDFILDRPFLFMVTGRDGSVLFAGIVRDIA